MSEHASHGRGTADDGPEDPDCPCRGTSEQEECAKAGCGFCSAARILDSCFGTFDKAEASETLTEEEERDFAEMEARQKECKEDHSDLGEDGCLECGFGAK